MYKSKHTLLMLNRNWYNKTNVLSAYQECQKGLTAQHTIMFWQTVREICRAT